MMAGVGLLSPPGSPGVRREGPFTRVLAGVIQMSGVMTGTVDVCGPTGFTRVM